MVTPHPQWTPTLNQQTSAWSSISSTPSILEKLKLLCHSDAERKKEGYVLTDITERELWSKMRSKRKNRKDKQDIKSSDPPSKRSRHFENASFRPSAMVTKPAPSVCFWHPGHTLRPARVWSCCNQPLAARGCESSSTHNYDDVIDPSFRADWKYHKAGILSGSTDPRTGWRPAVALDCEMGHSAVGESELIRLTAVDFISGKKLFDA
ncbi:uncharacterized protein HMPREF1541_06800 [Cyphellophora europaea CBS 101466]|uniref:Exonuclease domain-containing protein n=1 Tax=Cyphellophora europaea (strain CBS 101466) TaxID=1220924 RepID=W2RQM0_CYPE1|nr:uncharacterized protein HMPREF1541_06800 [Cyphellophora europaea CBS 101466]ETN38762.1 hypothetical protein HMPREF1541_06800 [Cyphellophora europaea CBS 101466]